MRTGWIGLSLLMASGCCLETSGATSGSSSASGVAAGGAAGTTAAVTSAGQGSAGLSSGGSSGGATTGGSTTGSGLPCAGVFCAAFYDCDPGDGICKCGGQPCDTGNCSPDSGACLPGCSDAGGMAALRFVSTGDPLSDAQVLPTASLNALYAYQLAVVCTMGPEVQFMAVTSMPPGLTLYSDGQLQGVPLVPSDGGFFEFQAEVTASSGGAAFQNFLLNVSATGGPPDDGGLP